MNAVVLKTKVQTIYYEDENDNLSKQYDTSEGKRLSQLEAGDILLDRGIQFKEILKVKYEVMYLEIPVTDLEQYILETTNLREKRK